MDKRTRKHRSIREAITFERVLCHYEGNHQLILASDASLYGIAAVLSQRDDAVQERPRTMTPTERKYARIDKEALSLIFGVTKFHKFLLGRPNLIFVTDHKPLLGIFKKDAPITEHISPRMNRWALMINAYNCTLIYRPGRLHGNADAFSRLPLPNVTWKNILIRQESIYWNLRGGSPF